MEVFRRAVRAGDLPLWNAFVGFGTPLLADPNFQLLYPATWLVLLLPPPDYYRFFVVAHALLGGMGVLVLGKRCALPPVAAAIAGGLFAVSGPFLSTASLFHHYAGAAWMPWVIAALARLRSAPGRQATLGLAFAVSAQLLAGSADLFLMTVTMGIGWLVWHEATFRGIASRKRFVAWLGIALALGLSVSSAQWLPAAAIASESSRWAMPTAWKTYWSIHPASLLDLWMPRFVAELPLSEASRSTLFEGREPLLASLYLGAAALPLALLGILGQTRVRRLALSGFVLFLIIALGKHTPIHSLLFAAPGFSFIRYPAKFALPAAMCWALLVGAGAAVWIRGWSDRERARAWMTCIVLGIAAVVAIVVGAAVGSRHAWIEGLLENGNDNAVFLEMARWRAFRVASLFALGATALFLRSRVVHAPRYLTFAGIVLVLGDVAIAGQMVNPLAPRAMLEAQPGLLRHIPLAADPRVHVISPSQEALRRDAINMDGAMINPAIWSANTIELFKPPMGARWGIYGSFDGDFTAMAPPAQTALSMIAGEKIDSAVGRRLLRLAGVDFVIDGRDTPCSLPEVANENTILGQRVRLLRVPRTRPRVFLVEGVRPQKGDGIAQLLDPGFAHRREVIVHGATVARAPNAEFHYEARIVDRTTNRLVIEAWANRPALLVVLEAFRPGWRARLDGRNVPIWRANVLFRAVSLSAGRHQIEMSYRPLSVIAGAAFADLGLIGAVLLTIFRTKEVDDACAAR
jgi:hypothetical protein